MNFLTTYRALTIALLLLSSAVYCQEIDTLTIDDLNSNGYLIKDWKLITRQSNGQDNAITVGPDWKIVNPMTAVPVFKNETGTSKGTLRFEFYADASVVGIPIYLCVWQCADTEITLDGVTIAKYKNAKGSVQFPLDMEIPYDLIAEITEFRVAQNRAKKK